jgi:sugar/nucleoside kinase (ribokinase family)
VVLDPAPARDVPDQLLRLATYVTPNEGELARLVGAPVADEPSMADIDGQAADSSLEDRLECWPSSARAALD